MGVVPFAVVGDGRRGRAYVEFATAPEEWTKREPHFLDNSDLPNNPRDFKTPNYGLTTFADLFTPRQLVALTTFITYQSRGMKVDVAIDGPAAPFYEKGRAFYYRTRGQFDLACYQCHDANAGKMLRGERLSEGHTNGFPSYKLKWQEVGSTHRQFRRCNSLARSEPYDYGADEYVNLELYLAYRGRGLPIEAPSVRP